MSRQSIHRPIPPSYRLAPLVRRMMWCAVGLGIPSAPFAAQSASSAGTIDRLVLVRCIESRSLPCVRGQVTLDGAMNASAPDGDASATPRWSGRLGPYPLQWVSERVVLDDGPPRAVLVLIDASGSMADGGAQAARAAVRSFLRDLGSTTASGTVRAGVAAFASHGVVTGIRAAGFGTPDAATRAIDALAPPAGNTGLYSAVAAGAERVATEARTLGSAARAALVVVTDGRNDVRDPSGRVRAGDDPGLLDGPAGRAEAAELAQRLGVTLYFVGVGSEPDMTELAALAGQRGLARRTALDAVALQEALAEIGRALTPTHEVTFAVLGAERTSLTGVGWPVELIRGVGRSSSHFVGRWQAPLLMAPAFDGIVFPLAAAPEWLRVAAPASGIGQRGMVMLFLVALGIGVWWLPRALWLPDERSDGTAPASVTPSSSFANVRTVPLAGRAAVGAASGRHTPSLTEPGGVRSDVREASPRRASDVTAEFAVPANVGREKAPTTSAPRGRTFAIHSPASSTPVAPAAPASPSPRPDPD